MSVKLNYKDTIQIIDVSYDGYGDKTIQSRNITSALFMQSTGTSHASQTDMISTSAHAYIDPTNSFVVNNHNRLEGMLVVANPFGADQAESWYKISRVIVGQDKLLRNKIDNVHIYLSKSSEVQDVS